MNDKVIEMPDYIVCQECKRKEATQLCDFVIREYQWIGHPPSYWENGKKYYIDDKMSGVFTCDKKLCKECSTKVGVNDYCKKHAAELKNKLMGVKL